LARADIKLNKETLAVREYKAVVGLWSDPNAAVAKIQSIPGEDDASKQRRLGRAVGLAAIVAGAALSGAIAPPQLVLASTTAFLLSELADFAVYTPLQSRGLVLAVLASSVVGLIADSILFLWLAFGSLDFLAGQIVGKLWMVVLSLPFIHWIRKREIARQVVTT